MNPRKLDEVVEAVRADLHRRSQFGIAKYGTTLEENALDRRGRIQHAYEEALDLANYLKWTLMSLDADIVRPPVTKQGPRFVAFVGRPGSGKTTAQKIVQKLWGIEPVDDGWPLRDFAIRHLGLSLEQVTTDAGKREIVQIAGQTWEVRKILGEIGRALEEKFGEHILPWIATRELPEHRKFSFGSVRLTQPLFYDAHDGLVVEIERQGIPETGNVWDRYALPPRAVSIQNPGDTELRFEDAIRRQLEPYFGLPV